MRKAVLRDESQPELGWKVEGTCGHKVRGNPAICKRDEGHKGTHTPYVRTCDGCDRTLPTSSFYGGEQARNPWDDVIEAEFCFLCTQEARRDKWTGREGMGY